MSELLCVEELKLYFRTLKGPVQAVDRVSFTLERNRSLVIVGESGCGKSSLARAILRLLPRNVHTYTGRIFLDGLELMSLSEERFRREVRWSRLAFVPQAAMNSLNPVLKVKDQLMEPLLLRSGPALSRSSVASGKEALARVEEVSGWVGLPLDFLNRYPFELSGGMRQRAVIAMALVAQPQLVILDEPTSALDVLTQASIMNMLKRVKCDLGVTFILITHDIATSSELAEQAAVMYAGQIVELCEARRFYREPLHPYSQGLMASVPRLRARSASDLDPDPCGGGGGSPASTSEPSEPKPKSIPGRPPSLIGPPPGCRFAPRCFHRFERCDEEPPFLEVDEGWWVKCWLYYHYQNDKMR